MRRGPLGELATWADFLVAAAPGGAGTRHLVNADVLAALGPHEIVSVGSSLKFCVVAEGGADLYPRLGPTMEWDTAAGQCVAECAGARVLDASGAALHYNRGESLLNPHFGATAA
mgnify:CR=1 FL=1